MGRVHRPATRRVGLSFKYEAGERGGETEVETYSFEKKKAVEREIFALWNDMGSRPSLKIQRNKNANK